MPGGRSLRRCPTIRDTGRRGAGCPEDIARGNIAVGIEKNPMSVVDRKRYWDLRETLEWICTRANGVAVVSQLKEENTISRTMFSRNAVLNLCSLLLVAEHDFEADREATTWQAVRKSSDMDEAGMIGPCQTLNYLLRQVQIRRIRLTAIRCGRYRYRVKRLSVSPAELNDIEFRITPGHRTANVGLWSRSRNTLTWRSPLFSRADIIRVWPVRKKKTAAVFRRDA